LLLNKEFEFMSTTETSPTSPKTSTAATPAAPQLGRRRQKTEGRTKRVLKLKTDKEFAKAYFEAKSKRSNDKKSAFRKKKSKKK
jgi:hypothetical protein